MQVRRKIYIMIFFMGILLFPLAVLYFQVQRLGEVIQTKRYPYVIFITIDTLRADFLGCYGDNRIKTPTIDKLVKQGRQFEEFSCQIPITNPSHCSIFTGLLPHEHGVLTNGLPLSASVATLPGRFRDVGYKTAAFVSGFSLVNRISGLQNSFEVYDDGWSGKQVERHCTETTSAVISWLNSLKSNSQTRLFLWVHYFDPHQPYAPESPLDELYFEEGFIRPPAKNEHAPESYETNAEIAKKAGFFHVLVKDTMTNKAEPAQVDWNVRRYSGEITAVDREIGRLLTALDSKGFLSDTMLVLTADHGEGFEHDYFFAHGDRLYESSTRIPCVIWLSDDHQPKIRIDSAQTIDLMPTLLQTNAIQSEQSYRGTNLLRSRMSSHHESTSEIYAVTPDLNRPGLSLGPLTSIRTDLWKLIALERSGDFELYNLSDDPGETANLWGQKPRIQGELTSKINRFIQERPAVSGVLPIDLDDEIKSRLRELGYIQ